MKNNLRTLLSRPCGKYGVDSSINNATSENYEMSASYHKTPKNERLRMVLSGTDGNIAITGSKKDNWYNQQPIPSCDLGYSWISASYDRENSVHYPFGHVTEANWKYNEETGSIKFAEITNFGTLSGSYVGCFSSSLQTVTQDSGTLNLWLCNQNGPYGYPSWKQTRTDQNGMVRYLRNHNFYNLPIEDPEQVQIKDGLREVIKPFRSQTNKNYIVPPVTSRYKPIRSTITSETSIGKEVATIVHSHGNNLGNVPTSELENKLGPKKQTPQIQTKIVDKYINDPNNPTRNISNVAYSETVFPKEENTYLDKVRGRVNFSTDKWWKNNRDRRTVLHATNSQGYDIPTSSIWPLDARSNFQSALSLTGGFGGEGELLNNYTTFIGNNIADENFDPAMVGNTITKVFQMNLAYDSANLLHTVAYQDRIVFGTPSDLDGYIGNAGTNKFTISAWAQMQPPLYTYYPYPTKETLVELGQGDRFFYLSQSKTDELKYGLAFSCSYGGDFYEWATDADFVTINNYTWHHLAMTFDSTQADADKVKFYHNGSLKASTTVPVTAGAIDAIANCSGTIGSSSVGSFPFIGLFSNISTFTDVLSLAEIQEIYNSSHPRCLYNHSKADKLLTWWNMGSGYGEVTGSRSPDDNDYSSLSAVLNKGMEIYSDMPYIKYLPSEETNKYYGVYELLESDSAYSVSQSFKPFSLLPTYGTINTNQYPYYQPIFDLAGRIHGTASTSDSQLIPGTTKVGTSLRAIADVRDTNVSVKHGALYARRTVEYTGVPWPIKDISAPQGTISVHFTGSYIFAGDTNYTVNLESGKYPYFEDYKKYMYEIQNNGKNFSVVPEFRISDYIQYYVDQKEGNFLFPNEDFLKINANDISKDNQHIICGTTSSLVDATIPESSSQGNFFQIFSNTDFVKYFSNIKNDYKNKMNVDTVTLSCNSLMKFVPYEGFYPTIRTLQMVNLFSQSYGDFIVQYNTASYYLGTKGGAMRAFETPFFAPGLLYNSIKSGIAVDFPYYSGERAPGIVEDYKSGIGDVDLDLVNDTGYMNSGEGGDYLAAWNSLDEYQITRGLFATPTSASCNRYRLYGNGKFISLTSSIYDTLKTQGCFFGDSPMSNDMSASWNTVFCDNFTNRIPFEGLLEPENYLSRKVIWDMNPEHSASLRSVLIDPKTNIGATWDGNSNSQRYKMAMHNFLAETPNFFLKDKKFTTFISKEFTDDGIYISEEDSKKCFGMDVYITNSKIKNYTDYYNRRKNFTAYIKRNRKTSAAELDEIKGIKHIMYSRNSAFGPGWVYNDLLFRDTNRAISYHYSYEPFTPCYQDGFGLARILFIPLKGAGNYTLDDIFKYSKIKYMRSPENRTGLLAEHLYDVALSHLSLSTVDEELKKESDYYDFTAQKKINSQESIDNNHTRFMQNHVARVLTEAANNWMQLSASVNLKGKTKVKKVIYEKGVANDFEPVSFEDSDTNSKHIWTIQTKWETPIFNFINKTPTAPLGHAGTGSVAKGMWHQYGENLAEDGIIFGISDLPNQILNSEKIFPYRNRSEDFYLEEQKHGEINIYFKDWRTLAAAPTTTIRAYFTDKKEDINESVFSYQPGAIVSNASAAQALVDAISGSTSYQWEQFSAKIIMPPENKFLSGSESVVGVNIKIAFKNKNTEYGNVVLDDNIWGIKATKQYPGSRVGKDILDHLGENSKKIKVVITNGSYSLVPDNSLHDALLLEGINEKGEQILSNEVLFMNGTTKSYKVQSLADLVGFSKINKKLGQVAEENEVFEAVVAIPFVENNGEKKFFAIERQMFDIASGKRKKGPTDAEPGKSIVDMANRMRKYVIPPTMNFLQYNTIKPFAMYIFEFSHKFTKKDLGDMWQNLPPDFSTYFKAQTATISHPLLANEFYNGNMDTNLRWMVFKVKQKAEWNYFSKTADSSDDARFKFDFKNGSSDSSKTSIPEYSYNWPYDFFSMVELIKMDANINFKKKEENLKIFGLPPMPTRDPSLPRDDAAGAVGGGSRYFPVQNIPLVLANAKQKKF